LSTTDLNGGDIIVKFELQVNDLTELSPQEELDLLNDKYQDVCMERPWEFLKTNVTGALAYDSTAGMWYITKPADFSYFCENNQNTDNTLSVENNAAPRVIFVGTAYAPFQVVNYSDRIQYRTQNGVCWLDLNAGKIYFPVAPSDTTYYNFDYIKVPADLTTSTTPIFPNRFRKMLWFAMATDNEILQLSSKANSYAKDNLAKYQDTMAKMNYWQDNLFNY
jgi:hypothetical protein